jgi:hypothetical protein
MTLLLEVDVECSAQLLNDLKSDMIKYLKVMKLYVDKIKSDWSQEEEEVMILETQLKRERCAVVAAIVKERLGGWRQIF